MLTPTVTPPQSFGFLDNYAKKEIRRTLLKAVSIPGYQVPYSSREMPIARGFGTGGLQITLSLLKPTDTLKVIDQGSDESVNAVNLRKFVAATSPGVTMTSHTPEATLIQTRHRIPEFPLKLGQILVLQVPYPDALVLVEASEAKRKRMHGEGDYARLWVKLYEDMVKFSEITISHRYPTRINGHYVIDPSPIPRFDVPKLHQSPGLYLFGAGREKKIYAVPPYTDAEPLSFDDIPFQVEDFTDERGHRRACAICGSTTSFLDECLNDAGDRIYQCSDSDYCLTTLREAHPPVPQPTPETAHATLA
ncbi:putative enzyme of phosphonate metabolism [Pleurocapsa sp. PCC 7327]|uniref:alpha-D-ribose 1-methylphosphonate 5-phosphate C-P-lyase PhnJ n=1 Tax=Pleurocapsa sp. PCC 7327 TaxID=118163 RepID=UPI00029F93E8|nr:alpha-D-ribose 1-methylphosphonate 5-phosphate C-P-lyase PhnJ [Pleurocapsa sp. PCC 7327]AFY78011.1 putative enzyme of phosphonate metabolism [Pleurocapsa sp. PCC 7327]